MLPLHPLDRTSAAPASLRGPGGGEMRPQKPKSLPCKYCSKRFRRVEHVQRHERTHTKEKPFACTWDCCGKTFGRRDLLVRHEKLVHLNDGSKETSRPRKLSSAKPSGSGGQVHVESLLDSHRAAGPGSGVGPPQAQPPDHHQQQSAPPRPPPPPPAGPAPPNQRPLQQRSYHHGSMGLAGVPPLHHDPRTSSRVAACNLDLLSDAALASEGNHLQPVVGRATTTQPHLQVQPKSYGEAGAAYAQRPRDEQQRLQPGLGPKPQHQPRGSYYDYNLFLDDFGSSPHFLPPLFDSDQKMSLWPRSPGSLHRGVSKPPSQYPSRLGIIMPDNRDAADPTSRSHEDSTRPTSLRISAVDHTFIKNRVDEFSAVLPTGFVFPSRHTVTRFLEGYVAGFHEYLPFLHLPTLSPVDIAPELLLAILAVGAQYRFENSRGHALWYAAKAVATEQVRRRHSSEVNALLPTPSAYSPHSTRPSPSSTYRHSFASAQSERSKTQDAARESYSLNTPEARLETIQAVLLLFAVGLWGVKTILNEALSLQSNLAMLIREDGLDAETKHTDLNDWDEWIRVEGATRTKLIAYCFFNLCSTAYNTPPLMLTSELRMVLPLKSRLWRAETAWQWQDLRQSTPMVDMTVHEAFSRLFLGSHPSLPPAQMSSFGHHVLIHALIQHVYLLKQASLATRSGHETRRPLKPDDVEEVSRALRIWQSGFEQQQQRAADSGHFGPGAEQASVASLAHNSTALLRLAYIRLYADILPSRGLETRDAMLTASALNAAPALLRSLSLHRALFQAIHALSMLVKVGVQYVARTASTQWSIQHSLCNFECAVLLAKWLLTLASISPSDPPTSPEEQGLLEMVRRMLDETEFAVSAEPSLSGAGRAEEALDSGATLRPLAVAVVRLWAETFKGTHMFELVKVMGSTLDRYADLVDKPGGRAMLGGR